MRQRIDKSIARTRPSRARSFRHLGAAALTVLMGGLTGTASAIGLVQTDSYTLDFNLEVGAGLFHSGVDYSGQDRGNVDWQEGYFKGGLTGNYLFPNQRGSFYGGLSAIGSGTWGDGDAGGFTTGDERKFDLEDAFLGWKSGKLVGGVDDAIDFSGGRQKYVLGDGFLINGDSLNLGDGLGSRFNRGGAYWLAPRKAFKKTAIARIQTGTPLHADLFYLGSGNPGQGYTELAGVNFEYVDETYGALGASYFKVTDVNTELLDGYFALRDNLQTYNIRGQGSAGLENTVFSFGYAHQRGNEDIKVDADAWYLEGAYTFAQWAWSPSFTYRYSSFSGDDPSTSKSEAFDPLFYGFNSYGTWYQGEVAANYAGPFNSNVKVHHVALKAQPLEQLGLGALYFKYISDEPAPGVDSDFAQEVDLYAEWIVNEHLYVSPLLGIYIPGDGAEALYGNDDTNYYFQLVAVLTY